MLKLFKFKKKSNFDFARKNIIHQAATANQENILKQLNSTEFGLTDEQAEEMLKKHGLNQIKKSKFNWLSRLVANLLNPFNILLTAIFGYQMLEYFWINKSAEKSIADLVGIVIVGTMIIISFVLAYAKEIFSHLSMRKIFQEISTTTAVIRLSDSEKPKIINQTNSIQLIKKAQEIEMKDIAVGDLIYISAGDMFPCDVRIIWSKDLFVNQSSLTGESFGVEKHATNEQETKTNILDYQNICFTNTSAISGSAVVIAISTGNNTYMAAITKVVQQKTIESSFMKGIKRISWIMAAIIAILIPIILTIYGLKTNDWLKAAVWTGAAIVGLTPELMPVITTFNLTRGSNRLKKLKVIVKRLDAVQSLGAIDILCTDKTGTLTEDRIQLVTCLNFEKQKDEKLLTYLYLNSFYQTGLKNPIDKAILSSEKMTTNLAKNNYQKIDEIPFDFDRRRLSVVVKDQEEKHTIITKGAIEEILKISQYVVFEGKVVALDEKLLQKITKVIASYNKKGMRVIGIAYKQGHNENSVYGIADESNLIIAGFAAFLDIPKASAKPVIKMLKAKGVALKILTGDNEIVTREICRRVDFKITKIVNGNDLENLPNAYINSLVKEANVFVKLTPLQKADIIQRLQNQGHKVGFLGDGINDAPVLKQSDVAISVNNATDIAKEASDIVLLEKSLTVLEEGIVQGRISFGNILKYIKITIASNFGNVACVVVALFILPFEPMIPLQLLTQNLLYDISQFSTAFDSVDQSFIDQPQPWRTDNFLSFMFINGLASTVFDLLLFSVMIFAFGARENQTLFNSGWFVLGLLSQTLVVQMLRTEKIPLIQNRSPWPIYLIIFIICSIGIALPLSPLARGFSMVHLPITYFGWLALLLFGYCFTAQIVKMGYIKYYKKWL